MEELLGLDGNGLLMENDNKNRIELFCEINMFRVNNAKRKLSYYDTLEIEAQAYAEEMYSTGKQTHAPNSSFIDGTCEVIAWGCNTCHDAFGWWINRSTEHRDAILGNFSKVGIGIATDGIYVIRFC